MLKQASVEQIRKSEIKRADGYLVVAMCFYPRGLKKDLIHEYVSTLAPDRALFAEFKKLQATLGHEKAFATSEYEKKFRLNGVAFENLRRLAQMSETQDVFLICQCPVGAFCHRELLLLIAQNQFNAHGGPIYHAYPVFTRRMENSRATVQRTARNPLGLKEFPNDA